ncbi:MAG: helix-turn-helix domain-containing protein [Actinomycetales bacterium]
MNTRDRVGLGSGLGEYLRDQRTHARLSLRQLAEVAGVSNPYLSQVERGLRKPSAEVLNQLAKGLRISAEVLYERAGLLEPDATRPQVREAVLADPQLSERQRRVLIEVYELFCQSGDASQSDLEGLTDPAALAAEPPTSVVESPADGAGRDEASDAANAAEDTRARRPARSRRPPRKPVKATEAPSASDLEPSGDENDHQPKDTQENQE